jgi:hypothetical protein
MLGLPEEGEPAAWLDLESSSSSGGGGGGHGARKAPLLLLAAANFSGNLPLHYLATNPAVGDTPETLASLGLTGDKATAAAARSSGARAAQRGAALLTLVAQKHQAAAATKHAHGSLPLHLLCKNREGLSLASLEALIAAHPQVHFFSFHFLFIPCY